MSEPTYTGPDRRRSSPEEREQWIQEHQADEATQPLHHYLPKPLLVFLCSVLVCVLTWAGQRWVNHVETHIETAANGHQRLVSIERQVGDLARELREIRRDQLEEQLWRARRNQDDEAIRYFTTRLRRMEPEAPAGR